MMRRDKARSLIDPLFNDFANEMSWLHSEAILATENFYAAQKFPERWHWVAVPAVDLSQPLCALMSLTTARVTKEDMSERIWKNLNAQYQWLLVCAHETFEEFTRKLYAILGYLDPTLWRCSDFGSLSLSDIAGLELEWYQRKVSEQIAVHTIDAIWDTLRQRLPGLRQYESQNCAGINVFYETELIAALRHCIVHRRGRVDRDRFCQRLAKRLGTNKGGGPALPDDVARRVGEMLAGEGHSCEVRLVSRNGEIDLSFRVSVKLLASHAGLVYQQAMAHFGEEPRWKRDAAPSGE